MGAGFAVLSWIDRQSKTTTQRVAISDLTDANLATQEGLVDSLATAEKAVSLAALTKEELGNQFPQTYTIPTANDALRTQRLVIGYKDTVTGKKQLSSIPAPNTAVLTMISGSNKVDYGAGVAAALKTDFEAVVVSENDNAVAIQYMRITGRSLS